MAANLVGESRRAPRNIAIGENVAAWLNSDGALNTRDAWQSYVLAGQAYSVNIGAFSTPIVGGGNGTVLDLDQPEGIISVPAGSAIIPVRIHVQCQTPLLATDADESEILIAVDRANAWVGDGTATTEVALNKRTDLVSGSVCSCASAFTADMLGTPSAADPVLGIELAHSVFVGDVQGTPATAVWTKHELLYEPKYPPVIVGPAMLILYWGGTVATSGFAQIDWIELTSANSRLYGAA